MIIRLWLWLPDFEQVVTIFKVSKLDFAESINFSEPNDCLVGDNISQVGERVYMHTVLLGSQEALHLPQFSGQLLFLAVAHLVDAGVFSRFTGRGLACGLYIL